LNFEHASDTILQKEKHPGTGRLPRRQVAEQILDKRLILASSTTAGSRRTRGGDNVAARHYVKECATCRWGPSHKKYFLFILSFLTHPHFLFLID
jgi:hypothetical protein